MPETKKLTAKRDLKTIAAKAKSPRRSKGREAPAASDLMPSGKVVGAVVGAIKILRYLSNASEPVGVTRIAKDTKLNTSTCFNILRTLASEDLVFFDPLSKTYTVSLGIMDLAKGATALAGDISSVRPLMERIARDHGVTVTLWQPIANNRKVLIMSALTRSAMRIQMAVGQRLPMFIGATGRVFAAFSAVAENEMRRRFAEIRWDRPLSFEEFAAQVQEAARQGWAVDNGYFADGTVSVAVPILNDAGVAVMAVTATMFAGQYDEGRAAAIVDELRDFSTRVKRIVAGG
jgi:DNA-binding IclR family transcriptional regulator